MATITMDLVVRPTVPATATPWQFNGFDAYNALLTITCKTRKRTLLVPGHDTYGAKDLATALARMFLLADWACPKKLSSPTGTASSSPTSGRRFGARSVQNSP